MVLGFADLIWGDPPLRRTNELKSHNDHNSDNNHNNNNNTNDSRDCGNNIIIIAVIVVISPDSRARMRVKILMCT